MSRRERKLWIAMAWALLAATVGGLLCGLVIFTGRGVIPPVAAGLLATLILAAAFLAMLPWWRNLDHMQRDSHLTSWYWGGSFGGGLGVMLVMAMAGVRSDMFAGAALVWLAQMAGYAIALLKWWITHRSQAS